MQYNDLAWLRAIGVGDGATQLKQRVGKLGNPSGLGPEERQSESGHADCGLNSQGRLVSLINSRLERVGVRLVIPQLKGVLMKSWEKRKIGKRKAIEYLGGKCEICGYCKCDSAFDFHHRDPSLKDKNIANIVHDNSWDKVTKELDKCMLLCANCHRELHSKLNESKRIGQNDDGLICTFCNKPYIKGKGKKHCSDLCYKKDREKFGKPSKEELENLLWNMPTSEIAKKYNVSDNAVGKWAKKYNLKKPTRGYWRVKETNQNI